ncbi:hypothetical protein V500_10601 [Pseudogymnoascus sp. VKM F-4518 (FW-2643)]|nr:hypothetical protein V500_10601 [Pseudogymnoascus sp. VKM F-4518 (FW-2643)]
MIPTHDPNSSFFSRSSWPPTSQSCKAGRLVRTHSTGKARQGTDGGPAQPGRAIPFLLCCTVGAARARPEANFEAGNLIKVRFRRRAVSSGQDKAGRMRAPDGDGLKGGGPTGRLS